MVAFPLSPAATNPITAGSFDTVAFEWVGADTAVEQNLEVFAICLSGFIPGLGQYASTLLNHDAQVESGPVVYPVGLGELIRNIGGPDYEITPIPESPAVYYVVDVPYMTPTELERDKGVDHVAFYQRGYGADEFYGLYGTAGYQQVATVDNTGAWTWSGGVVENQLSYKEIGEWGPVYPVLSRPMPDEFSVPLSPFQAATAASGRLFAGDRDKIQVSDLNFPLRHRAAVRFVDGAPDVTSGTERRVIGEAVRIIRAVSSSAYGSAHVRVVTDKGMFSLDAGDPRSSMAYIGQIGASGRRSVAAFKDTLWFLDDQRQIRALGAGDIVEPARNMVDDYLADAVETWAGTRGVAANRGSEIAMVWWKDRLYCAFTPYGATVNTQVLVYDAEERGWTLDVLPSGFSAEDWIIFPDSNGRDRLYAIGDDGRIFEYEAEGQDDDFGTAINIGIDTPEASNSLWNPVRLTRVGVVADAAVGSHLAIDAIFRGGDGTVAGTIRLDDAGSDVWRYSPTFGGRGVGVRLSISGDVPAGWRLYGLVAEMGSSGRGPDV